MSDADETSPESERFMDQEIIAANPAPPVHRRIAMPIYRLDLEYHGAKYRGWQVLLYRVAGLYHAAIPEVWSVHLSGESFDNWQASAKPSTPNWLRLASGGEQS